jgi:hypothetical protein
MNITVEQKDNKLHVKVRTKELRGKKQGRRQIWDTERLIVYLKETHPEYQIEKATQKAVVNNFDPVYREGEWIFKLWTFPVTLCGEKNKSVAGTLNNEISPPQPISLKIKQCLEQLTGPPSINTLGPLQRLRTTQKPKFQGAPSPVERENGKEFFHIRKLLSKKERRTWMDDENLKNQVQNCLTLTNWTKGSNLKLLEIGFGNGRSTFYLSPFFEEITGIENSGNKGSWRSEGLKHIKPFLGYKFKYFFEYDETDKKIFKDGYYNYIAFFNICGWQQKKFAQYLSIDDLINDYIMPFDRIHATLKAGGYFCITYAPQYRGKSQSPLHRTRLKDSRFELLEHDYDDIVILRKK